MIREYARDNEENVKEFYLKQLFASHLTATCFIPLFKKVLPIYYTVIAWGKTDLFKHLLARKYIIIVSPFFRAKLLYKCIFNCTKSNLFEAACATLL